MRLPHWVAALLIVLFGAGAIWLVPTELPPVAPAATMESVAPAADDGRRPRNARARLIAVEQISPIVGSDGALVEALGLEMPGGVFRSVIPKGTAAPVTKVFTVATVTRDKKEMRIHLVRGDSERAEDGHSLGWFLVDDVPPGPAAKTYIYLIFNVADGAIAAAAFDRKSGRALPFVPSNPTIDR